ncbi:MAG: ATP-binding protein, partial [Candidatus Geothermarchaeales archaeon]
MRSLTIRAILRNFMSYWGKPTVVTLRKPLTLIAGPNGAGKSALLRGFLLPASALTEKSAAIRRRTLFKKDISIRDATKKTMHEALFGRQNLTASRRIYPTAPRFRPSEVLTYRRAKGSLTLEISHSDTSDRENPLSRLALEFTKGKDTYAYHPDTRNRLNNLDLIYLEPDSVISSTFVDLVGSEFEEGAGRIPGIQAKGRLVQEALDRINSDDRLIDEVHNGRFRDRFGFTSLFLSEGLATGAKKELLIYLLHLLKLRNEGRREWAALILVDELGQGLHLSQKHVICDALKRAFGEDEELRSRVRVVATTHSPSIYSFFDETPMLCDIMWVMREARASSQIIPLTQGQTAAEQAKQLVMEHLGMSVFELPRNVVFVEGATDREFYRRALGMEDTGFLPLFGMRVPEVLSSILETLPLSRERKYYGTFDGPRDEALASDLPEPPKMEFTGYRGLEELIFDIKPNSGAEQHWMNIERGLERLSEAGEARTVNTPSINVKAARKRLS